MVQNPLTVTYIIVRDASHHAVRLDKPVAGHYIGTLTLDVEI